MGKRDTADAIRYFLNRYRAEVLREPVAFEERGRVEPYTFFEPGFVRLNDGPKIPVTDVDVSFETDITTSAFDDVVDRAIERAERDAFDRLTSEAATTIRAVDRDLTIDDFRDVIHAMRREGYGSDVLYAPGSPAKVARESKGAAFFVGSDVADDLEAVTGDRNAHLDSIPVLESSGAPANVGVLVDVEGIAPPTVHAPGVPFVVRDGRAIVAIERVETDFEWVEGGR